MCIIVCACRAYHSDILHVPSDKPLLTVLVFLCRGRGEEGGREREKGKEGGGKRKREREREWERRIIPCLCNRHTEDIAYSNIHILHKFTDTHTHTDNKRSSTSKRSVASCPRTQQQGGQWRPHRHGTTDKTSINQQDSNQSRPIKKK